MESKPIVRLGSAFRVVFEHSSRVLMSTAAGAVVLMMFVVTFEVISRYCFNRPTSWAVEVSTYLLIAPVFLAAAYTLLVDGHVKMESIIQRLPNRAQAVVSIITSVLSLIFLVPLTWSISRLFFQAYNSDWHSTGTLEAPLSPSYLAMAFGSLMFCLAVLVKIINHATSLRTK